MAGNKAIAINIKNALKDNTSPYGSSMPPQKLSFKSKDDEWKKACINAIVGMGTATYYNGRTSRYNKQVNYNLVNSIFDEKDFLYVTDPWGLGNTYGEAPARMENYNIIRNVVEFLKGDDLRRPFSYTAIAVNGEAISVRQEYKANMLKEALAQYVQNEEAKYGLNQPATDENGQPIEPKTPEQIEKYMQYTYKDLIEKQTNDILKYLYKKEDIVRKFVEGWEHGIIAGEEIYHVGISYNEPVLRVVNPLFFDYDKNPDVKTIEDAQWCREERFMTKAEIIDEYREYLTDEDLDRLDTNTLGMSSAISKFDAVPGFSYSYDSYINSNNYNVSNSNRSNYINVNVCCWKTWKKIGFFSYVDPQTGEEVKKIVDESFKVPNEFILEAIPYTIEWEWINEVWSGIRLGYDVFINIGPIDNQCRTINNPSLCKLPYVGRIYNSTNSVSVSIVDLLKKYQFFYNTIMYRIELEIAKSQGKKVIIDIAQIPKNEMGLDKWMYYYSNTGIAFINSLEEGRPGDPNSVSKFNQFTSVDMSVGNLTTYLNILNKIEESVEKVTGVSRQRLGDTFSSESATGIQNSVVQSSIITEYMYFNHNNVKKEVLTQLVEAAKIAYQNNKAISYISDDMQRITFDIDSERLNNSDLAVFISNSAKDLEVKQKIESLLQAAMQNDKISMTDMVSVFKSNSTAELENIAKGADMRAQQNAQAQQEHEAQLQQLSQEHEAQLHADDREDKELDRENELAIAQIQALGFASKPTPENPDNSADLALQMNEVLSKREEASRKTKLEYDKLLANQINDEYRLSHEAKMQDKEIKLKEKELLSKEKIAKSKPKPVSKKK